MSRHKGCLVQTRVGSVFLLFFIQVTPCSRVLPDKLGVTQLITKFPAFYGPRMFITAFTSAPPTVRTLNQLDPVHAP
jgi:hypothetical protein